MAHGISGCVEAPLQLCMTVFLIMKEILDVPWVPKVVYNTVEDSFNNNVPLYNIAMWTLFFSVGDILKCALMTNIFNVYIGQIRSASIFMKYITLAAGHLPFFCHVLCFRVLAYSMMIIYIHTWSPLPIFLIWLCNIVIGKYLDMKPAFRDADIQNNIEYVKHQVKISINK